MAAASSASSDDDRRIDGVYYPRPSRDIDARGFERTKHALHFHGADWDLPLTEQRDALTKAFIADAAEAVGEPLENISDVRFAFYEGSCLYTKLSVRHKASVPLIDVQQMLAKGAWARTKALYRPRQRVSRKERRGGGGGGKAGAGGRQHTDADGEARPAGNLSFFGRANVGPEGPQFRDETDHDEEPAPYEEKEAARVRRVNSRLVGGPRFA